jgi:hypothetical protein
MLKRSFASLVLGMTLACGEGTPPVVVTEDPPAEEQLPPFEEGPGTATPADPPVVTVPPVAEDAGTPDGGRKCKEHERTKGKGHAEHGDCED